MKEKINLYAGINANTLPVPLPDLSPAIFIQRLHRFGARVYWQGQEVLAHVASSGRMQELFLPGAALWVEALQGLKSQCRIWLVESPGGWVCIHASWANRIVQEVLTQDFWPGNKTSPFTLAHYEQIKPETTYGRSRFDFFLSGLKGLDCYLEVKSVTLVENQLALFPDAPSARAARHLTELENYCRQGGRSAVLFLILRGDAKAFAPHTAQDPAFAQALVQGQQAGVEIYALKCTLSPEMIRVEQEVPIILPKLTSGSQGSFS